MNEEESVLMQKSQAFATRIATMTEYLANNRSKVFASLYDQVLRSGTSIMANVSESQFAQSSADFITKLHIALKEASETRSWLKLLYNKSVITEREYESMRADCSEIVALLVASLNTAKNNSKKTKNNLANSSFLIKSMTGGKAIKATPTNNVTMLVKTFMKSPSIDIAVITANQTAYTKAPMMKINLAGLERILKTLSTNLFIKTFSFDMDIIVLI